MKKFVFLASIILGSITPSWSQANGQVEGEQSMSDLALTFANRTNPAGLKFTEGFIDIDLQRLHYVEAGQGPLMIFYHGFPSFWFSFYYQMLEFGKDYRVVGIDGLGSHLSSKPDDLSVYRIDNLVRQLDQVARHLAGDKQFVLVGHDWGGALAWTYAQRHPERLCSVIVLNAPPYNLFLNLLRDDPEQQQRSAYMFEMRAGERHRSITENNGQLLWERVYAEFRGMPHFDESVDELFRTALGAPGAIDAGINWYRANIPLPQEIQDSDYWPAKDSKVTVPSLLIWGEDDRTFVPAFIEQLPAYAPRLKVHSMPGTGHWPTLQRPDAVNRAMRAFLAAQAEQQSSD